jgi:prophage antirepressor-like protein
MNPIAMFTYKDDVEIRVIKDDNGEPWFVGEDVTRALWYLSSRKALKAHCKYQQILKGNESLRKEIPPQGLAIRPLSSHCAF